MPAASFDFIYSVDEAIGWDEPKSWTAAEHLLAEDGVLVWIGDAGKSTRPATSLGLVVADVVGGWTGSAFDAKAALILGKKAGNSVTGDLANEASQFWEEGFKGWANSGVDLRWKTQAFCGAWMTQGEPPAGSAQSPG